MTKISANILAAAREIAELDETVEDLRADRQARLRYHCENASNQVSEMAAALRRNRIPTNECLALKDSLTTLGEIMKDATDSPALGKAVRQLSATGANQKIYDEFNRSEEKQTILQQLDEASGLFRVVTAVAG